MPAKHKHKAIAAVMAEKTKGKSNKKSGDKSDSKLVSTGPSKRFMKRFGKD